MTQVTKEQFKAVLAELEQDELIRMYLDARQQKKDVFAREDEAKKQIHEDIKRFKPR